MTNSLSQTTAAASQRPQNDEESTDIHPESTNLSGPSAQVEKPSQYTESTKSANSESVLSSSAQILGLRRAAAKKSGKSSPTFWLSPVDLHNVLEFMQKSGIDFSLPSIKNARRILNLPVDRLPALLRSESTTQSGLRVDKLPVPLTPSDTALSDLPVGIRAGGTGNIDDGRDDGFVTTPKSKVQHLALADELDMSMQSDENRTTKPNIRDHATTLPEREKLATTRNSNRKNIPDPNQQNLLL